jgi:hypothetical protein
MDSFTAAGCPNYERHRFALVAGNLAEVALASVWTLQVMVLIQQFDIRINLIVVPFTQC